MKLNKLPALFVISYRQSRWSDSTYPHHLREYCFTFVGSRRCCTDYP